MVDVSNFDSTYTRRKLWNSGVVTPVSILREKVIQRYAILMDDE